jgi:hypothetical protein
VRARGNVERPGSPDARVWRVALSLAVSLVAGCQQSALVGELAPPGPSDAAPPDAPGYVDGRVHYHAVFNGVESIYWIGGTGDPSRIELWIFQDATTCEDLSTPGWRERVRPTDLMGITLGGTLVGTYDVVPQKPPQAGDAYVLHEIDQADPVTDSIGESGTIVAERVVPGDSVSGTLQVTFPIGALEGAFKATWCPTGITLEP